MKTIKLPINMSEEDISFLNNMRREQSSVVRYSYNRFMEGKNQKEIRDLVKTLNINNLDSWFIQSGVMEGQAIYTRFKDQDPIIFGGKDLFEAYNSGKIDKAELKEARLRPLNIEGEAPQNGNRKFELDIIKNNRVLLKPFDKKKIYIDLPKLKKNYKKELLLLQQLTSNKELAYTVKLTDKNIFLLLSWTRFRG
jgi:predicted transposase